MLLLLAYRSFGGAATRPVDPMLLLKASLAGGDAAAATLAELAPRAAALASPASLRETHDSTRAVRRLLDGCGQQLQQVDANTIDESAAGAHALLAAAVDELGWVARMMQADAYAANIGMHTATDELRSHAAQCLAEARVLLVGSAAPEEVHGPA